MWPKALLLGDSQTQEGGGEGGWAQLLTDQYVRRLDIINRGFSGLSNILHSPLSCHLFTAGYNSRMLLDILPDILSEE